MPFATDDVLYCAMPLFHGNALTSIVFPALRTGATHRAASAGSRRRSSSPTCRRYGARSSTPSAARCRTSSPRRRAPDDRDHRSSSCSRPSRRRADIRAFRERFGIPCVEGYGSSENAIIMMPGAGMPTRRARRARSRGIDVAVVDPDDGRRVPARRASTSDGQLLNADEAIGEIVGRNVVGRFEGYYNNPEADARAQPQRLVLVGRPRLPRRRRRLLLRRPHRATGSGSTARTSPPRRSSASSARHPASPASRCTACPTSAPATR